MNEKFLMRPGDTFVSQECGCSFVVQSAPDDPTMAFQAPHCCCGHEMVKVETPAMVQQNIPGYRMPQPTAMG